MDLKKSVFKVPVGRVNDLKPLGHSGQRRLQAVVGSIDKVIGKPHCIGRPFHLVSWYEDRSWSRLSSLDGLSLERKLRVS